MVLSAEIEGLAVGRDEGTYFLEGGIDEAGELFGLGKILGEADRVDTGIFRVGNDLVFAAADWANN